MTSVQRAHRRLRLALLGAAFAALFTVAPRAAVAGENPAGPCPYFIAKCVYGECDTNPNTTCGTGSDECPRTNAQLMACHASYCPSPGNPDGALWHCWFG